MTTGRTWPPPSKMRSAVQYLLREEWLAPVNTLLPLPERARDPDNLPPLPLGERVGVRSRAGSREHSLLLEFVLYSIPRSQSHCLDSFAAPQFGPSVPRTRRRPLSALRCSRE